MKNLFKITIVLVAIIVAFGPVGTVTSEAKINTNRVICKNSSCGNTAGSDGYCSRHSSSSNKSKSSASTTKSSTSSKSSTTSKKNTTSNKKSNSKTDSYDKGYEDYWLNGDYDDDRYRTDWNYQLGVDDAMDEFE